MPDQTSFKGDSPDGRALTPLIQPAAQVRPPNVLPPWRVLLHNDDVNHVDHVVRTVFQLTPLSEGAARKCVLEAEAAGVSLVLVTHQERAELYVEQFCSCGLTTTAEPER